MRRALAWFGGGVVVAVVAIGIVVVAGMRAKSPAVLDTVRRLSRATKPLALRSAGAPGSGTSVVRHVGRATGRTYETPVVAQPMDGGFAIALPYGPNTDWLRNVLAQGSAVVVHDGTGHDVEQPEVVGRDVAGHHFPPGSQRSFRLFDVQHFLLVRRAGA